MATTKVELPVRDRLLAAANALFYQEGIHSVGIDRILAQAGVAKASLYSTFGSKEELVRAYLEARAESRQRRISERIASYESPRAKILGVFEVLGEIVADPGFRGCAFVNARAEGSREPSDISRVCDTTRAWNKQLFSGLARELGVRDPETVGRQLALLYDGTTVGASMDRDPAAAVHARALAEMVLDHALAAPGKVGKRRVRAPSA